MPTIDNDSAIRDRAYLLWEKAGRPCGLEHEHWAEARCQIEAEVLTTAPITIVEIASTLPYQSGQSIEIDRLRQALYAPEPFSFELFGTECPDIDLPIIIRQAA